MPFDTDCCLLVSGVSLSDVFLTYAMYDVLFCDVVSTYVLSRVSFQNSFNIFDVRSFIVRRVFKFVCQHIVMLCNGLFKSCNFARALEGNLPNDPGEGPTR